MGRRVNTLGSGDFFGELAAMDPGPRNATVTALTDLDVLIIGPRELSAMSDIPGFRARCSAAWPAGCGSSRPAWPNCSTTGFLSTRAPPLSIGDPRPFDAAGPW